MERQRASRRGGDGLDRHAHRHVDERRREPRRPHARLRPARRPLHAADRGRRSERPDAFDRLGDAGALLSRRQADRLPERRGRRRQRLGDGQGRQERAAGDEGGLPPRQQPGLAARRRVHRRAQALHRHPQPGIRRDLALPQERRQGCGAQREAELAEGPRRAGLLARRSLRLLLAGHLPGPRLPVQQERARRDLLDRKARSRGRPHRAVRHRPRRRGAPGAVAGRQAARVRAAAARQERALREGPRKRRGAARLGGARARPAGGVGDPGRLSRLRLDARQPRGRGLGAGQAVARDRRQRQGPGDPVPRKGHARGAQGGALPDGGGTGPLRRQAAALGHGRARRKPRRLLGARPPVREGPARGNAATADEGGRPLRALPEPVARRRARCLRHLERRQRGQRAHAGAAHRQGDGADEDGRHVPRAALLTRRPHRRLHALARVVPALAVAGRREGGLPRARRRQRRGRARHARRRRSAVRRGERPRLRDAPGGQQRGGPERHARQHEPRRQRGARGGEDRRRHRVRGLARRRLDRFRRRLPGVRRGAAADRQAHRPRAEGGLPAAPAADGARRRVPPLVRRQPQDPLRARRRAVHRQARGQLRLRRGRARRAAEAARARAEDRLQRRSGQAARELGAHGRAHRHDARRRGDRRRRPRRARQPHRGRRPARQRRGPRRSRDGRRVRQDDRAGAGRRALARLDGRGGADPAAELDRLRVARLRRHDAARPVERHQRDLHPLRAATSRPRRGSRASTRPGRSSTAPRAPPPRGSTPSTTRSRT